MKCNNKGEPIRYQYNDIIGGVSWRNILINYPIHTKKI
jgi:hypothetical protein